MHYFSFVFRLKFFWSDTEVMHLETFWWIRMQGFTYKYFQILINSLKDLHEVI